MPSQDVEIVPINAGPIELSAHVEPWERQWDETDKAWRAFQVYRDMDPEVRSMVALYKKLTGKDPGSRHVTEVLCVWKKKFRWLDRTLAYDRHLDTQIRQQLEERRMRARLETADLGQNMRRVAARAVQELKSIVYVKVKVGNETKLVPRSALSPQQIAQLARIGTELERQALGLDADSQGSRGDTYIGQQVIQQVIADDELLTRAREVIGARSEFATPIDQL